jgi:acetolactate decarboxylase
MKSIAIEISDSTYHKIRCLGSTDVGSVNRIAAAALADYLHGDVGWLGAASYPLRKSGQSTHIPMSAFTLYLQELGIGMTPPGAPVVILDGHLYRIGANGTAVQITEDVSVPYSMMVNFEAETLRNDFEGASIDALVDHCESLRAGSNVFYVFRVDGRFRNITVRSALASRGGVHSNGNSAAGSTNRFEDVQGTVIGFWSSRFTSTVCAPGYHFYFISPDEGRGGVMVDCSATGLRMLGMPVTRLRIIRPDGPDHSSAGDPTEIVEDDPVIHT